MVKMAGATLLALIVFVMLCGQSALGAPHPQLAGQPDPEEWWAAEAEGNDEIASTSQRYRETKNQPNSQNDGDQVFSLAVNLSRQKKSYYVAPDVDWMRQLAPRVLEMAYQPQELIRQTIRRSLEDNGSHHRLLVNIINSTVYSEDQIEDTLDFLNDVMVRRLKNEAAELDVDAKFGRRATDSNDESEPMKPLIINVFLLNSPTNEDSEPASPTTPNAGHWYNSFTSPSEARPPSAMELAYISSQSQYLPEPDVQLATSESPEYDSYVTGPHFRPQAQTPPTVAAPTRRAPVPRPVAVSHQGGMSNRMKGLAFGAVPAMAGLATTWQLWWPAVAALTAGRKKRSLDADPEVQGRAIDPQWLAILMGKRYLNTTNEELKSSDDFWKNRGPVVQGNRSGFRSTTRRSVRSTTTSDSEVTGSRSGALDESTPRFDGWNPTTSGINQWYHTGSFLAVNEVGPSSTATDQLDSAASPSGDFDIVANFVRSTLNKMIDGPDTPDGLSDSFVFNTPSFVSKTNEENSIDTSSAPILSSTSSTSTSLPEISFTTDSVIKSSPSFSVTKSAPRPAVSSINIVSGVPAMMPSLPAGITNSPTINIISGVPAMMPSLPAGITNSPTINLIAGAPAMKDEILVTPLPAFTITKTEISKRSTTTTPMEEFDYIQGQTTPVTFEENESLTTESTEAFYDYDDTTSNNLDLYDSETDPSYYEDEFPMPNQINLDQEEKVIEGPYFAVPNEIPTRVQNLLSGDQIKPEQTSSEPPPMVSSSTTTRSPLSSLVTLSSFAPLTDRVTSLPVEIVATTQLATTDSTSNFGDSGYVVETSPASHLGVELVFTDESSTQSTNGIIPSTSNYNQDANEIETSSKPYSMVEIFTTDDSSTHSTDSTAPTTMQRFSQGPYVIETTSESDVGLVSERTSQQATDNTMASTLKFTGYAAETTSPSSNNDLTVADDTTGQTTGGNTMSTLKFDHGGYVVETTSPSSSDTGLLVSDVVSTQQMIDNLLKIYGTPTVAPVTLPHRPSTSAVEVELNEYDDYYDTTGNPKPSYNLTDLYTTYSPTPEDGSLDVMALFNQLQSNLTTGLLSTTEESTGLHFVNTSTDIVIVGPFEGATPSSVIEIEPLTDIDDMLDFNNVPQVEAVEVEEDIQSVVVEAANVAPPPNVPPSQPNLNPNANLLLGSSVSVSSGGVSVSSGSTDTSSSDTSSTSTTVTTSSGPNYTTGLGGLALAVFVASLSAVAYSAAVVLPIALPIAITAGKKKKRRNYGPPRRNYPLPAYAKTVQKSSTGDDSKPATARPIFTKSTESKKRTKNPFRRTNPVKDGSKPAMVRTKSGAYLSGPFLYPTTTAPTYDIHREKLVPVSDFHEERLISTVSPYSSFYDVTDPLDDYDAYGPTNYHSSHNYGDTDEDYVPNSRFSRFLRFAKKIARN